jgi:hypothetical protein
VAITNVGIPIALSFGLTEDSSLYDAFYTTLKSLFDIDLPIQPILVIADRTL